jgi:hypothetical protein
MSPGSINTYNRVLSSSQENIAIVFPRLVAFSVGPRDTHLRSQAIVCIRGKKNKFRCLTQSTLYNRALYLLQENITIVFLRVSAFKA